jgi:hypothetical protein
MPDVNKVNTTINNVRFRAELTPAFIKNNTEYTKNPNPNSSEVFNAFDLDKWYHLHLRLKHPIWYPDLGPGFGTLIWTLICDPDLGHRIGTLIWDPDLGPRFGTLI